MTVDLRPEDFRRLWPHAVARMMDEAAQLEAEMRRVSDRVEVATQQTLTLMEQLPEVTRSLQATLQRANDRHIERFAAAVTQELAVVHEAMRRLDERIRAADKRSEDALAQRRSVDRDSLALERREAAVGARERKLACDRQAFARLSLWSRITAGRQWSWWRLRFIPR